MNCPKCRSRNVVKSGFAIRKGGRVQSYKCKDCGHTFIEGRSRKAERLIS